MNDKTAQLSQRRNERNLRCRLIELRSQTTHVCVGWSRPERGTFEFALKWFQFNLPTYSVQFHAHLIGLGFCFTSNTKQEFSILLLILPRLTLVAVIFRVWRLLTKTHIKTDDMFYTFLKSDRTFSSSMLFSLRSHFTYDTNVVPLSLQKLERRQITQTGFSFLLTYICIRQGHINLRGIIPVLH